MLIPGLPTAGAQQDIIKPKRTVQPTAETELLHEALEQVGERRRRDQGHYPERRRNRARRQTSSGGGERRSLGELPSKGLLVDIQV